MGNEQTRIEGYLKSECPALLKDKYASNGPSGPYERLKLRGISQDFSPGTPGIGKTRLRFHLGALREEAGACGVVWGNWFSNRIIFDTTVGGMVYRVGIWNKKTDCSRRLRH